MATTKDTTAAKTATTPPVPLTLQQKFIKLREAVPSITQKAHSDGVQVREDLRRVPASHSGHE